ncbi:lysophospholipid acyltransferase family protein [Litoribacter alkaliphilus]|uniref:Lysophospholipid acyltransferase family protein n=1 Tax=Litoribacter ruber TaxID=702568 RepID=A0AAP2CK04_9BACT|nr:lysophospholipid acyltransferase family protein [Litoribacter alkaliphilus]MBS9523980.1 lysophospholipid acyltransferase family protein [Litoribacter alkaliphilus]
MFIIKLISRLPLSVLYILSDFLYFLACHVLQYRKEVIVTNLRHAFPEKSEKEIQRIKKDFYRNFTDSIAETVKFLTIPREELLERVKLVNYEIIRERVEAGKLVIGVCPHFFNWEAHLLAGTATWSIPVETVYQKVNEAFFENLMYQIRSRFGCDLVERGNFQRNFIKKRNEPRLIVLAADQRPTHSDIRYWRSFMNQETAFFEGAEKIAKRFDSSVIFGFTTKPKRGHYTFTYQLISDAPHDATEHCITDRFVELTEENIRQEPALYLWSHNRWKEKREKS